jgi:hypothetical protein
MLCGPLFLWLAAAEVKRDARRIRRASATHKSVAPDRSGRQLIRIQPWLVQNEAARGIGTAVSLILECVAMRGGVIYTREEPARINTQLSNDCDDDRWSWVWGVLVDSRVQSPGMNVSSTRVGRAHKKIDGASHATRARCTSQSMKRCVHRLSAGGAILEHFNVLRYLRSVVVLRSLVTCPTFSSRLIFGAQR